MKESLFIEQIMVIGENRKFTAAIIIPAFDFIKEWAKRKGLNLNTKEEIVNSVEVKERIWQDIQRLNRKFGKIQQIKKFALITDEWSVDTNELTPTLKLKRRVIREKYKDLYEKIYADEETKHYL